MFRSPNGRELEADSLYFNHLYLILYFRKLFYQNFRQIDLIVIHCSATRRYQDYPVEQLREDHRKQGFADIGYHFYVRRDGEVTPCRPLHQFGAHARGFNDRSIGICYEGGLEVDGSPCDTRTYAQKIALLDLLRQLKAAYPKAQILGHCELSPSIHKACPCFVASEEYCEL